jgi:[ribosomal protein S5]-alanine N-acetyltransferase
LSASLEFRTIRRVLKPKDDTETARLVLRRPTIADVPALFEFLGDTEAMRYTRCDALLRECRRRIIAHEWRRRRDGYAPWTVVRKSDCRIIGWGGLYNDPFDLRWGVEVGYFFHPTAWGQGYGSELMASYVSLADNVLQIPEVRAFSRPDNFRSRRVLEKAGFEAIRFVPEIKRLLYRRARNGRLVRPSFLVLQKS